ncbi:hypothetical protein [Streptomyces tendae]|uniref:Uncharacterized protein n=1 Tax=Streptomyces tendae TaxID=1932 RepID=A0ABX5ZJ39_STRTE|nr:hypothetical protein [Streptomyces tendae]QER84536.1 hypothetical protein F3L20_00465 [Streptomyces tendae]
MPGTVLLLAASPLGRGRLVDAASVLPVLAAVPPAVLSGTDTANVVELADPLEPQAVLTRLRAAAAAPGPLTVYAAGELRLDRRQRLPHLALARTTPATVRYTALPWHWFRDELRLRPAGATTLFLDLHADADTWQALCAPPAPGRPFLMDCGRDAAVYGRIAPPPSRRGVVAPSYMKALATVLRSGRRPAAEDLHQQVLARIAPESAGTDLVLAQRGPLPGDPHAAVTDAVRAGRHAEADALAARLEQAAGFAHGPVSEEALHWTEVRADLAMLAGDAVRSCQAWMALAGTRLAAGQPADAPAVEAAVDRAHHQWGLVDDPVRVRELGLTLVDLRGRVPGRRDGAAEHVRRRLRAVQASVGVPAGQLRTDPPQGATAVP